MEKQEQRTDTTSAQFTRPTGQPADQRKKERKNAVYAAADGKIFEIPLDVAEQYSVTGDRATQLQCLVAQPSADEGAEVGGRDMRLLASGRYGYHSNWAFGSYIWWRDGNAYSGWHWHPYVNNPLAYDVDD